MPRDYKVSLEDILEASRKIEAYVNGIPQEAFGADSKTLDAVI
jgi:uncharacterized protein with HEPN domain